MGVFSNIQSQATQPTTTGGLFSRIAQQPQAPALPVRNVYNQAGVPDVSNVFNKSQIPNEIMSSDEAKKVFMGIGTGIPKGFGELVKSTAKIGDVAINKATFGAIPRQLTEENLTQQANLGNPVYGVITKQNLAPKNAGESFGKALEQGAEWLIPGAQTTKIEGALTKGIESGLARNFIKAGVRGTEGVVGGALQGADGGDLATYGALGSVSAPLESAYKTVKGLVPQTVKENVARVLKNTGTKTLSKIGNSTELDNAVNGFETIRQNAPNIIVKDINDNEKVFVPHKTDFFELPQALKQTKDAVYKEYSDIATKAGDQGVTFGKQDFKDLANSLAKYEGKGYTPAFSAKAKQFQEALNRFKGKATPSEVQSLIEQVNLDVNPLSDKAGTQVANDFSVQLRKLLDDKLEKSGNPLYQATRDKYAQLKSIEKDVIARYKEALRKSNANPNLIDGITSLDAIMGIIRGDPIQVARGGLGAILKKGFTYLRNPEVNLRRAFKLLEQGHSETSLPVSQAIKSTNNVIPSKDINNYSQVPGSKEVPLQSPQTTANTITNKNSNIPNTISQTKKKVNSFLKDNQKGFISTGGYKETGNLTTKILKDLEGKTTVSRQYILDATNRGELKQAERDITRQVLDTMKPNIPKEFEGLANEAKKYKSAEEFVKRIQGSATQYGDYTPELRHFGMGDYKNITELGVKPDRMITIYRGIDDITGKIPRKINNGDFVTTDFDSAMSYAGKDNVVSMKVPAKTLYTDGVRDFREEPFHIGAEYVYTKEKPNPLSESQLVDIYNKAKGDTINVKEFADKVKSELLPLKAEKRAGRYENITLPEDIRGSVKNYHENIYQSPIKTSAGQTHFSGYGAGDKQKPIDNYFGHTRIEDMADNKTRRVIEVQSDLYQKGNLENEYNIGFYKNMEVGNINPDVAKQIPEGDELIKLDKLVGMEGKRNLPEKTVKRWEELSEKAFKTVKEKRSTEVAKLQQYNDPTAHFRMVREEIKKAAQDGKTKLQFPTGETAMKIEGLGETPNWRRIYEQDGRRISDKLEISDLKTGETVQQAGQDWIITDVLGDGKFKAVPKDKIIEYQGTRYHWRNLPEKAKNLLDRASEEFDISGKVDTNNPIYKFYEKDVQKYLNRFGGKRVVDDKGVSWIEVPITKEQGKAPVEAFGKIKVNPLNIIAGSTAGAYGATALYANRDKIGLPKRK